MDINEIISNAATGLYETKTEVSGEVTLKAVFFALVGLVAASLAIVGTAIYFVS